MCKKISLVVLSCLLLAAGQSFAGSIDGLWHMDENSGTVANDGIEPALTAVGTGTGTAYSWVTPGYNAAGAAVETTAYNTSYLVSAVGADSSPYLEVECWINPTDIDLDGSFLLGLEDVMALHFGPPHGEGEPYPGTPADDTMRFLINNNGTWLGDCIVAGADVLFDGNWHKITGIYDGMPDENGLIWLRMFWDDNQVAAAAYAYATPQVLSNGENFYVGCNPWAPGGANQSIIGAIDEISINNIPEPATLLLLGFGGLLLRRRKA